METTTLELYLDDLEEFVNFKLKYGVEKKRELSNKEFFHEMLRFWGDKHD